jgi:hypothetical protein
VQDQRRRVLTELNVKDIKELLNPRQRRPASRAIDRSINRLITGTSDSPENSNKCGTVSTEEPEKQPPPQSGIWRNHNSERC